MSNFHRLLRPNIVLFCALLFCSGCSAIGLVSLAEPVTNLGNGILRFVGILEPESKQSAGDGLVGAMQNLNREEEYYFGRAVAAKLLSMYEESESEELIRYVNRVGQVLVRSSSRPNTFAGYHFTVLKSEVANAYAAPGGFVFVTDGLLQLVPSEDALASVLAHEIAHIALRHGEKAVSNKNLNDTLLDIGAIAGSLSCADIVQHASLLFGTAVDDVVSQLLDSGYSREQEREADAEGQKILQASGYRTSSAKTLLALLRVVDQEDEGGWFNSHPATEERQSNLAAVEETDSEQSLLGYAVRRERFFKALKGAAE